MGRAGASNRRKVDLLTYPPATLDATTDIPPARQSLLASHEWTLLERTSNLLRLLITMVGVVLRLEDALFCVGPLFICDAVVPLPSPVVPDVSVAASSGCDVSGSPSLSPCSWAMVVWFSSSVSRRTNGLDNNGWAIDSTKSIYANSAQLRSLQSNYRRKANISLITSYDWTNLATMAFRMDDQCDVNLLQWRVACWHELKLYKIIVCCSMKNTWRVFIFFHCFSNQRRAVSQRSYFRRASKLHSMLTHQTCIRRWR